MTLVQERSPVQSAHVGEELEVHYRRHPYFGCKVGMGRVERRATGRKFVDHGSSAVGSIYVACREAMLAMTLTRTQRIAA